MWIITITSFTPQYSEPTVYTSSAMYGDGDGAIIFSNFDCQGYESNMFDCNRTSYGYFTCSRDSVVGVKCKDCKLIDDNNIDFIVMLQHVTTLMSVLSMVTV